MKLFFCDVCNESIPLQDIKENRATTIKGKIFCRKCNPLNELRSSGDAGSQRRPAGLAALLGAAVLGGALVAGAAWWMLGRKGDEQAATGPQELQAIAEVRENLADLRGAVRVLQAAFRDVDRLRSLPSELDALRQETVRIGEELRQLERDVRDAQEGLVAVGTLREKVEATSLKVDENSRKLVVLEERLEQVRKALEQRPLAAAPSPAAAASSDEGTPADKPAGGPADAELEKILERLRDEDPMVRWEAIDEIRRRHDRSLAAHVLPLLDDPDTFVRAQAIYTLGELKAAEAVPKLIQLLRDEEVMIREEALTSLIAITGQNLRFDVDAPRAKREAGIRKWEQWYAANKDRF